MVEVTVIRTGGFAGLRREWVARPTTEDADKWIALIDECPWDSAAAPPPPRGADLFVWRIDAQCAQRPPLRAELPEDALQGPWRALVDEVREAQTSQNPT